ncbi:Panacea domain-containing protein [Corynebacterium casei]|uniref:Panacea domain-containing protein n=1 Tax=Corynebacterium casei TaxID=160386 RepID=UPI003F964F35
MATTIDVAQYIYNKLGWIDSCRLMNLTYYSQAWILGWYGRSMVSEEYQAWSDGPVEPNLHSENKYHRSSPTSTNLPSADIERLSDADKAVIDSVLDFYGSFSTHELNELVKTESPWQDARAGVADGEPSKNPLSQSSLKAFYALQEIQDISVPIRPNTYGQHSFDDTRHKLFSTAARWRTALALLAER